jgi:hypothetical protein
MSESNSKKNDKSCILTLSGQQKLKKAYNELKETPSQTELAQKANIDRFVVKKILDNFLQASDSKPQKPVTYKCLYSFCTGCLSVDLQESDFENPPKIQPPRNKPALSKTDDRLILEPDGGNFQEQFTDALCELNYTTQKRLFEDILSSDEPAVSFFIFGKPDHGQRWLALK